MVLVKLSYNMKKITTIKKQSFCKNQIDLWNLKNIDIQFLFLWNL